MIKVLFFAQLQEEMGTDFLELDSHFLSVKDVKNYVASQNPLVNLQQVMTAVNEEFALDDEMVKDGDIIAFLPPVSGG